MAGSDGPYRMPVYCLWVSGVRRNSSAAWATVVLVTSQMGHFCEICWKACQVALIFSDVIPWWHFIYRWDSLMNLHFQCDIPSCNWTCRWVLSVPQHPNLALLLYLNLNVRVLGASWYPDEISQWKCSWRWACLFDQTRMMFVQMKDDGSSNQDSPRYIWRTAFTALWEVLNANKWCTWTVCKPINDLSWQVG